MGKEFLDSKALIGGSKIQWEKNLKPAVVKLKWPERVVQVRAFHVEKIKADDKWKVEDTAKELERSLGSVSEDLMLAQWMMTYPKIERMAYKEAIRWVRERKRDLDRTI